jgi:hypothetical protein
MYKEQQYDSAWKCRWVGGVAEEFEKNHQGRGIRACKGRVQCVHDSRKGEEPIARDVFFCEAAPGKACDSTYCLRYGKTRELTPKARSTFRPDDN